MRAPKAPTPWLAIILPVLACSCTSPAAPPPADTPAQRLERARTLASMEVEGGTLDATLDLGASLAQDATANLLTVELGRELSTEERDKVRGIMRTALAEVLTRSRFEAAVAKVYSEHFTPAELDQLIEFFASPTGAKILALQGELTNQIGDATEAIITEHLATFSAAVDQALAAEFEGYVVADDPS